MSNHRVFFALLRRDLKVLKSNLPKLFLDSIILLCISIIEFGYLFPMMGMPHDLIGPIFIGHIVFILIQLGFSLSIKKVSDIKFNRFIDYHFSLPLSLPWLMAEYITNFIIKGAIVSLPMLSLGIILLGKNFIIIQMHWLAFTIMYFLILVFFALLFLYYSFAYDYDWFFTNIWVRRINPLFMFGSVFIIWKKLFHFSKPIAFLFLCNPLTYVGEGLRATLIGGDKFLPIWACMLGLSVSIVGLWLALLPAIRKKLDVVTPKEMS